VTSTVAAATPVACGGSSLLAARARLLHAHLLGRVCLLFPKGKEGHIHQSLSYHCRSGVLCQTYRLCSRNSIVELLYVGVGGAELRNLEYNGPKHALIMTETNLLCFLKAHPLLL
jgi:hypothetical protein